MVFSVSGNKNIYVVVWLLKLPTHQNSARFVVLFPNEYHTPRCIHRTFPMYIYIYLFIPLRISTLTRDI